MNLAEQSKQIEKTCAQVRSHFKTEASTSSDYVGIRNERIMPYVIRYSDKNGVKPAVIYKILGSGITCKR